MSKIRFDIGEFAIRSSFDKTETSIHNGTEIEEPIIYRPDVVFRENNYVAYGKAHYNGIHIQNIKSWIRIGKDDIIGAAVSALAPNAVPIDNYMGGTVCCFDDDDKIMIEQGQSLSEAFMKMRDRLISNLVCHYETLADTLACYDVAKENQHA